MSDTLVGIADAVRSGAQRAVDVVERSLASIAATNRELNAFVHVDADEARARAAAIDTAVARGENPGPLAGVPIGVKDLEDCRGMPTRHGSAFFRNAAPAERDSIHCERLRKAGVVFVGKTAAAEFGMDAITATRAFGVTRNPWKLDRTSGGSSGGSASAVSAGMVPLATGSDGGGSIRSPAGFTGLVGLKPSHGRIPRDRESMFSVLGGLTTTVGDTARYLDVVAGFDARDRMSLASPQASYEQAIETLDATGLRVGWSADYGYAVMDSQVVEIAHAAAEALIGAAKLVHVADQLILENHRQDWRVLNVARSWHGLAAQGFLPDRLEEMSDTPRRSIGSGREVTMGDFVLAERRIARMHATVAEYFTSVDVLLSPDAACAAFAAEGPWPATIDGRDTTETGVEPLHFVANSCWNPSITIPAGLTTDGLPVGLMITTRLHRDDVALRLARLLELSRPWPRHAPGFVSAL